MKFAVAAEGQELTSPVASHFERARYLALFDTKTGAFRADDMEERCGWPFQEQANSAIVRVASVGTAPEPMSVEGVEWICAGYTPGVAGPAPGRTVSPRAAAGSPGRRCRGRSCRHGCGTEDDRDDRAGDKIPGIHERFGL
ncbi:MAG: hypothetical protein R6V58_15795 [Planctomycetota bacterium]